MVHDDGDSSNCLLNDIHACTLIVHLRFAKTILEACGAAQVLKDIMSQTSHSRTGLMLESLPKLKEDCNEIT
jgi:hypothetical protein